MLDSLNTIDLNKYNINFQSGFPPPRPQGPALNNDWLAVTNGKKTSKSI